MCYTGECVFEVGGGDCVGDCMISDYARFTEEYGLDSCIVGGIAKSPYDEETIRLNKDLIENIRNRWFEERYSKKVRSSSAKTEDTGERSVAGRDVTAILPDEGDLGWVEF